MKNYTTLFKIFFIIFATLSGVLVIVYGEADDSPGAQGIGLLTIIFSVTNAALLLREQKHK